MSILKVNQFLRLKIVTEHGVAMLSGVFNSEKAFNMIVSFLPD